MNASHAARCVALVGPHLSGKTTLLERLLAEAGAIPQPGLVQGGTAVGDASPEARARGMSVELNVAACDYLGERWTILDAPGSVELADEARRALAVCDLAVVVVDPAAEHVSQVAPLLDLLDGLGLPHVVFVNKLDQHAASLTELVAALQAVSARPLVLREVPLRQGGEVTGFVDLVSERAFRLEGGAQKLVQLPDEMAEEEREARRRMLEAVADHDDTVLARLLEDQVPTTAEVYEGLAHELAKDEIVEVFLGSAERGLGIGRLWKALRHEAPGVAETRRRLGLTGEGGPLVQAFHTTYLPHAGRLSLVRLLRGGLDEATPIAGARTGGLLELFGAQHERIPTAKEGEVVGLLKVESLRAGELATETATTPPPASWPAPPGPVYSLAIHADKRTDDVKLPLAIARLIEEDPALQLEQDPSTSELVLAGQGELHLHLALERLRTRQHLPVVARRPRVPYRETIRKPGSEHARYKRQSGGHGQFGDVHLDFAPLPRGSGVRFHDTVVGGVVPKQFIPAVEEGVREALQKGPLGFPVVDVAVTLTSGTFHSVDSSDQSFRMAARLAVAEALPKLDPVLLEPVVQVEVVVPREATSKAQRVLTGRRGQLLGFDAAGGRLAMDRIEAYLPLAELHDLIIELRSISHGLATFTARPDHHAELVGKLAERVLQSHGATTSA